MVCNNIVSEAREISINLLEILELIIDHLIGAEVREIIQEVSKKMRGVVNREILVLVFVEEEVVRLLQGGGLENWW